MLTFAVKHILMKLEMQKIFFDRVHKQNSQKCSQFGVNGSCRERETGEMLKIGLSDFGRKWRILLAIYAANITFRLLTVFSCQKKITISNCFSALTFYNGEKEESKQTYISIM